VLVPAGVTELVVKRVGKDIVGGFTGLDESQFDSGTP
jgi:hypothetical protein